MYYYWMLIAVAMGAVWQMPAKLGGALGVAALLMWVFEDKLTRGWRE